MTSLSTSSSEWPSFSAEAFRESSHLFHMCIQVLGKLMLSAPFDPHWSNLAMPITSRGVTTGIIPYQGGAFSVDVDLIEHKLLFASTWGKQAAVPLEPTSVAELTRKIFQALKLLGVEVKISLVPQEVTHPIPFDQDHAARNYDRQAIHTWWQIAARTYCVLLKYHSRFYGITPKIGLFFGTLDLRDARYRGKHLPITKGTSGYIARNAMDDVQFEVGWSASNENYLVPSFFAFAYPKPEGWEQSQVGPPAAKWIPAINEFVLDYQDLRRSRNPDVELLDFFESSYRTFAKLADWDPEFLVKGEPI